VTAVEMQFVAICDSCEDAICDSCEDATCDSCEDAICDSCEVVICDGTAFMTAVWMLFGMLSARMPTLPTLL